MPRKGRYSTEEVICIHDWCNKFIKEHSNDVNIKQIPENYPLIFRTLEDKLPGRKTDAILKKVREFFNNSKKDDHEESIRRSARIEERKELKLREYNKLREYKSKVTKMTEAAKATFDASLEMEVYLNDECNEKKKELSSLGIGFRDRKRIKLPRSLKIKKKL